MSDKPVKAYAVTERFEAMTVIVFATSGIAARRQGANEHDTEFECIDSCRRAPWADQYWGIGKIPAQAWIDNGYSQACDYCETMIYGDTTEDEAAMSKSRSSRAGTRTVGLDARRLANRILPSARQAAKPSRPKCKPNALT